MARVKTAAEAQKERNGAVLANLIDPVAHLDTLIALAGDDEARVERAQLIKDAYLAATADSENPASALLDELLYGDDDGQALVTAVSDTYATAKAAVTAVEGLGGEDGKVAQNSAAIGLDADGNGTVTLPDGTMGSRIDDHDQKLMLKKQYIENLGTQIGFNAATNEGTVMLADGTMGSRIDLNAEHIGTERTERMAADASIRTDFAAADDAVRSEFAVADTSIRSDFEAADMGLSTRIGSNESAIMNNRNRIGELSEALDIVRSGVAASMALAGMPAINGRGIAIGVGSFDGESAFAVGFQIQGEMASFQIGVTSSGGETGASAGVGFQF